MLKRLVTFVKENIEPYQVSMMLDTYGSLLTDKQYDALDLYYNEDLSLAEIAEQYDISRQGVRGTIKDGLSALCEFEDKLSVIAGEQQLVDCLKRIEQSLNDNDIDEARAIVTELLSREG